jgi:hypothetical protein
MSYDYDDGNARIKIFRGVDATIRTTEKEEEEERKAANLQRL